MADRCLRNSLAFSKHAHCCMGFFRICIAALWSASERIVRGVHWPLGCFSPTLTKRVRSSIYIRGGEKCNASNGRPTQHPLSFETINKSALQDRSFSRDWAAEGAMESRQDLWDLRSAGARSTCRRYLAQSPCVHLRQQFCPRAEVLLSAPCVD